MANTLQADFLSACLMATSRPSRSWCWITKARTGHWKFLSPLLREPWAEISLDSSGDGCLNREDPTSVWGTEQVDVTDDGKLTHASVSLIPSQITTCDYLHHHCGPCVWVRLWPGLERVSVACHTQTLRLSKTSETQCALQCRCLWSDWSQD